MDTVEKLYWNPSMAGPNSTCRIKKTPVTTSEPCDPAAVWGVFKMVLKGPAVPGVPDFNQKRLIIWYQKQCVACQNSRALFDALAQAGKQSQFTVHEVEATEEMLARFPHVTVVPMYDYVQPAGISENGPYGSVVSFCTCTTAERPGRKHRSMRNDVTILKEAFPNLVLP